MFGHGSSMKPLYLVVYGEPASKANSRKIVRFGSRLASIKSDKARAYAKAFLTQVEPILPLYEGELRIDLWIHYASRRPDLDESLVLDLLQGVVYANDRQVRERHVYHLLDRDRPRVEMLIQPRDMEAGAEKLARVRALYGSAQG